MSPDELRALPIEERRAGLFSMAVEMFRNGTDDVLEVGTDILMIAGSLGISDADADVLVVGATLAVYPDAVPLPARVPR